MTNRMLPVTHAAAIAIHSILILSIPLHPPVSRSVDRLDLRSRIQLVPQSFHSNGQGVLVHIFRAVCPNPVDQCFSFQNASFIFHQDTEPLLFIFTQLHLFTVSRLLPPISTEPLQAIN